MSTISDPPTAPDAAATAVTTWRTPNVLRAALVAIAVWFGVQLVWSVNTLVFIVFLGSLFGLAVASGVDFLARWKIRRGIGSVLIVFSVVGVLGGTLAWAAPTLMEQGQELQTEFPAAIEKLSSWIDSKRSGLLGTVIRSAAAPAPTATVVPGVQPPARKNAAPPPPSAAIKQRIADAMAGASRYLFSFVSSTLTVFGGLVMIIFLAIYIGAEPAVYRGWILSVVPAQHRPLVRRILSEISTVLRKWLVTQMIAMLVIGLICSVTLLLLGVRAPLALGIIAGLMEFVPTVGPIISAVPAILMGFTDSPTLALWVGVAYWAIQFLENNLLIPFLMRGEMDLPPAITLVAQALMTIVFGFLGLMVAVPLTAAVLVPIRMIAMRENEREREMRRQAQAARLELATAAEGEANAEGTDRGPAPSSIRATTRGIVARRSAMLGITEEMALPRNLPPRPPAPEKPK